MRRGRAAAREGLTLSQPSQAAARPEPALRSYRRPRLAVWCKGGPRGLEARFSVESAPGAPGLELLPRTLKTPPKSWCLPFTAGSPAFCLLGKRPVNARRVNNEVKDPTRGLSRPALPNRTLCDDVNRLSRLYISS